MRGRVMRVLYFEMGNRRLLHMQHHYPGHLRVV